MTEPIRPQVTVSDPGRPEVLGDVLGADEPRRRLPRWVAPFATGALLAGVAVPPAVSAVRDERRAARAAQVLEDQRSRQRTLEDLVPLVLGAPRLSIEPDAGTVLPDGSPDAPPADGGTATLTVTVTARSGVGATTAPPVVVDALRLTGSLFDGTEQSAAAGAVDPAEAPAEVTASFPVPCAEVTAAFRDGARPTGVAVVVVATPRSGRQQETAPLGLPDELLQDALLDACGLGDPAVPPTATVAVQRNGIVVEVGVGRGEPVTLVGLRLPGLVLDASAELPLPLGRFFSAAMDVVVVRVDCARFTPGPLVAVFRAADGSTREVEAVPAVPPGTPLADHLARLRAQRCG